MPLTKLQIFKIRISDDSKFTLDKRTQERINLFLAEENNIYINHSTSIVSEGLPEFGVIRMVDRFLIISLIYKDLNASEYDLKNTNKKVKAIVTKEIESGDSIDVPEIETSFDKEMRELEKKIDDSAEPKIIGKVTGSLINSSHKPKTK